jgi:hypothetical protein
MTQEINAWLPGALCVFIAWLIGWRQGVFAARAAARRDLTMEKLLRDAENSGVMDLRFDGEGQIVGGSVRQVDITPLSRKVVVLRTHDRTH